MRAMLSVTAGVILVAVIVLLAIEAILLFALFWNSMSVIKGAPFVPTSNKRLDIAFKMLEFKPDTKAVDIGCGDGRVMIKFAEKGCFVDGYDINPILITIARWRIKKKGFSNLANVYRKDFWRVDYSKYDLVYIYGIPSLMRKLSKKLKRELNPGTTIVAVGSKLPNFSLVKEIGQVYLYKI